MILIRNYTVFPQTWRLNVFPQIHSLISCPLHLEYLCWHGKQRSVLKWFRWVNYLIRKFISINLIKISDCLHKTEIISVGLLMRIKGGRAEVQQWETEIRRKIQVNVLLDVHGLLEGVKQSLVTQVKNYLVL